MRNSLPNDTKLTELFSRGLKNLEIAEQYGVTRQAVSKRRRLMGLSAHGLALREAAELLRQVWDIKPMDGAGKHTGLHQYVYLRALLRLRLGDQIHPDDMQNIRGWVPRLRAQNVVVTYSRDEGFFFTPRIDSDDSYIIRWPGNREKFAKDRLNLFVMPSEEEISGW